MITTYADFPDVLFREIEQAKKEVVIRITGQFGVIKPADRPIDVRQNGDEWVVCDPNIDAIDAQIAWTSMLLSTPQFESLAPTKTTRVGRLHVKRVSRKIDRRYVKCQTCGKLIDRMAEGYGIQNVYEGHGKIPVGQVYFHRTINCLSWYQAQQ